MLTPLHLGVTILTDDVDIEIFTSLSKSLVESFLMRIIIGYKKKVHITYYHALRKWYSLGKLKPLVRTQGKKFMKRDLAEDRRGCKGIHPINAC